MPDTMTAREAKALADKLVLLGEQLEALEADCIKSGQLIRALLKHVNPSDVFQLQEKEP